MQRNKAVLFAASSLISVFLGAISCFAQTTATPSPSTNSPIKIAITFDDLPAHSSLPPGETRLDIARRTIAALRDAKVPPIYGFVNGVLIQQEPNSAPVLREWVASGNKLGNHTWSHLNLNQRSVEDFEKEVQMNEALLSKEMGSQDWHWLRYPFLSQGDTPEKREAIRSFLQKNGYKIAAVTMSFGDYMWNEPYARCVAKHDEKAIAVLENSYLNAADESITHYRELSHALLRRDIPYVLLMHIGAFDARMLPRLLDLYRSRRVEFTSLEEAEKDPFYNMHTPTGFDSLESAMGEKHLSVPPHNMQLPDFDAMCR